MDKAKAIVAAVGAVVTLGFAAWQDKAISLDEANGIITAVLAVLTVIGVYAVPNKPAS